MINNRQAGRRRGRGGNGGGGGGNGSPRQGNPGRADNGNRIDSRARGNASQLLEKYKNMAADAQRAGDRVATEYYLQFADHYFRVLSEQRGRFEEQQPHRGRDNFDDGDEEFGDEGEPVRTGEQGADGRFDRDDRQREDRPREDRPREDRQRDDRPRADRQRDDQPREDRQRDDRPRAEAQDRPRGDRVREDRPREDRPREDRPREDRQRDADGEGRSRGEWQEREPRRERRPEPAPAPVEIAGQRRAEPPMAGESLEQRAEEVLEADRPLETPAPRRRGRPRREAEPVVAEVHAEANGFEADRLPPALTIAANDEAPVEAKPRRRRARPVEDTPTAAE